MITILQKEINEFFDSLIGYVVVVVFLIAISLVMWVFPTTSVLEYGYATLEPLFTLGPYLFMFLIPAITMRSFAEEKRSGTMELLFTLPFRLWQIILGKWLGAVMIVLISLVPTVLYYFSVSYLGNPVGNIDSSGTIGSYLGLSLLGMGFVAIGLFTSAMTGNQIVAFVTSVFLCFLCYQGFEAIATLEINTGAAYFIEKAGMSYHYLSMSRGLLTFADVAYFLGLVLLFLLGTYVSVEGKR